MQRRNFGPNTPFASPRLGARRVLKTSLLCRDLASASDAMPQRQRYTDCGTRTPRARGTVKIGHEAFSSVSINELLKDADWPLSDGRSVRFEPPLDHGGEAGCAPFERRGRVLAVLEAKRTSVDLSVGEAQGQRYDDLLGVPFIFLSNGEEVWFRDKTRATHFRRVDNYGPHRRPQLAEMIQDTANA